jgi:hypothetical protein
MKKEGARALDYEESPFLLHLLLSFNPLGQVHWIKSPSYADLEDRYRFLSAHFVDDLLLFLQEFAHFRDRQFSFH